MLFFQALPALRSSLKNRLMAAFGIAFLALASLGGFAGWVAAVEMQRMAAGGSERAASLASVSG